MFILNGLPARLQAGLRNRRLHRADVSPDHGRGVRFVLSRQTHGRGADDHAAGKARHLPCLFRRGDAEAGRAGNLRVRLFRVAESSRKQCVETLLRMRIVSIGVRMSERTSSHTGEI